MPFPLVGFQCVLDIQVFELWITGGFVIHRHEGVAHKLFSLLELCGISLSLCLYNKHLVNGVVAVAAEHQEVGYVSSEVSPVVAAFLLIASYLEVCQRVVAVVVDFKFAVVDDGKQSLREVVGFQELSK